jgi:hypothetical protein
MAVMREVTMAVCWAALMDVPMAESLVAQKAGLWVGSRAVTRVAMSVAC